ncbi:MAG TPA: hypothetical protein VH499_16255 [Reyranella sp.]
MTAATSKPDHKELLEQSGRMVAQCRLEREAGRKLLEKARKQIRRSRELLAQTSPGVLATGTDC